MALITNGCTIAFVRFGPRPGADVIDNFQTSVTSEIMHHMLQIHVASFDRSENLFISEQSTSYATLN